MPKATKKIKANNGNDASAPLKLKTCSKTNWQTPRVAMNERTTVRRSIPAAKILRSNKPKIIPMMTRTIGIINLLSWREATSVSY